jgi:hypothetical protein
MDFGSSWTVRACLAAFYATPAARLLTSESQGSGSGEQTAGRKFGARAVHFSPPSIDALCKTTVASAGLQNPTGM